MDLIENWTNIVKSHDEKAIIPFLKQMNEAQKQDLLPTISKTAKTYLEVKDRLINNKHFYTKKASNKQDRILNYSIFVCAKKISNPLHKWLDASKLITPYVVDNILNWYCPNWLSDYVNNYGEQKTIPIDIPYDLVIKMFNKGFINPSERLLAKLLPKAIYSEIPNQKRVYKYQNATLLKHPDTLKKHIWYLFEYKTQIYNIERYLTFENKKFLPKNCWYDALKKYSDSSKIERVKLLKACISATTNPTFNKPAVGWFAGLFEHLSPSEEELLSVQLALFSTFTLPYSRVINVALKNIQKIALAPNFKVDDCLKNYEKVLSIKTKSVVSNGLIILEKLANQYPNKSAKICALATTVFIHRTEVFQIKAAKIIEQYGQAYKVELSEKIAPNFKHLFSSTQQILQNFLSKKISQPTINQSFKIKNKKLLHSKNSIPLLKSFDDFVKLALQIFDNQQPYHFDLFLAGLLKYRNNISGPNIKKFVPIFKRAYQLVYNELPIHQGMIDNILGIFLMDFGDSLIAQHPEDSQELKKIAKSYLAQGFFINNESTILDLDYAHLYRWYNPSDPSEVYTPLKKLLGGVLTYLHQNKILPLLSTPTHAPMWIDPVVFVQKLAIYQSKNEIPNAIDLQLAISRIAFENSKNALLLAKEKLNEKYFELVDYLLSKNKVLPAYIAQENQSTDAFKDLSIEENKLSVYYGFTTAAITKNSIYNDNYLSQLPDLQLPTSCFTGNHNWMIFREERRLEEWNPKTQRLEYTGKPFVHKELQIKVPKGMNIENQPNFLYQYFPGNNEPFRPNTSDVKRLLGMLPNNPEPLLALLIADNLKYPTFREKTARKRVIETVDWLSYLLHKPYGQAAHLFLATSMLCADKEIRLKIGELWQKGVSLQIIDSSLLGKLLGKIEKKEFAPLKRFTDLAQNHLYKVSPQHNQALEQLIANLVAKLPAIPIKNTKQLLLLYRELLAINSSKISNERIVISLALWKDSPSLKKVIKELVYFVD